MYLLHLPEYIRQRFLDRAGHKPGLLDVVEPQRGSPFWARPNLYYLQQCGRPCWLPIFAAPATIMPGWQNQDWAINTGWPCEHYRPHNKPAGPYCYSRTSHRGDLLRVVGQVSGDLCEELTNEIGQRSDIWNIVLVPSVRVLRNHSLLIHVPAGKENSGGYYYAFAPDIWLGNLGWRDMPSVVTDDEIESIFEKANQDL